MRFHSRFENLQDAFEEMEFLTKTTGRTHRLYARKKNGYRVVEALNGVQSDKLIAELNCRNLIGEKEINTRRGLKIKKRVISLSKQRKVV